MKIEIYAKASQQDLATFLPALLARVPEDAETVTIAAAARRAMDLRPCQRPGMLEWVAFAKTATKQYKITLTEPKLNVQVTEC